MNSTFTRLADEIAILLIEKFAHFVSYSQEQLNKELADLINSASYSLNEKIYAEKINFFWKEEGEVFGQYIHHNAKIGAFVVLDKGSEKVARELAMQAVANSPTFLTMEDLSHQVISTQLEQIRQLVNEENPSREPTVIEKIVSGKFSKWVSEVCFLEQDDFRNPGRKIKQILHDANTSIKYLFLVDINN